MALGRSLRSPAEGEGHEGFPPPPDKDLDPHPWDSPGKNNGVGCHFLQGHI